MYLEVCKGTGSLKVQEEHVVQWAMMWEDSKGYYATIMFVCMYEKFVCNNYYVLVIIVPNIVVKNTVENTD